MEVLNRWHCVEWLDGIQTHELRLSSQWRHLKSVSRGLGDQTFIAIRVILDVIEQNEHRCFVWGKKSAKNSMHGIV